MDPWHAILTTLLFVNVVLADEKHCDALFSGYQYTITSPHYPDHYPLNATCVYTLQGSRLAPCSQDFYLQFLRFQLEDSGNCEGTYLRVGNRSIFCGNATGLHKQFSSENNSLRVEFRSNGDKSGRGFKILVTTLPCINTQNNTTMAPFDLIVPPSTTGDNVSKEDKLTEDRELKGSGKLISSSEPRFHRGSALDRADAGFDPHSTGEDPFVSRALSVQSIKQDSLATAKTNGDKYPLSQRQQPSPRISSYFYVPPSNFYDTGNYKELVGPPTLKQPVFSDGIDKSVETFVTSVNDYSLHLPQLETLPVKGPGNFRDASIPAKSSLSYGVPVQGGQQFVPQSGFNCEQVPGTDIGFNPGFLPAPSQPNDFGFGGTNYFPATGTGGVNFSPGTINPSGSFGPGISSIPGTINPSGSFGPAISGIPGTINPSGSFGPGISGIPGTINPSGSFGPGISGIPGTINPSGSFGPGISGIPGANYPGINNNQPGVGYPGVNTNPGVLYPGVNGYPGANCLGAGNAPGGCFPGVNLNPGVNFPTGNNVPSWNNPGVDISNGGNYYPGGTTNPPGIFYPGNNYPVVNNAQQCCSNSYSSQRFLLSSPGFPALLYSARPYECSYTLQRNSQDTCRMQLHFKFFNFGSDDPFCSNGYVEIEGRRYCGCKTGQSVSIPFSGYSAKTINVRYSGYPRTKFNGFQVEVIQQFCSGTTWNRNKKSIASNDTVAVESPVTGGQQSRAKRELSSGYSYPKPGVDILPGWDSGRRENFLLDSCQSRAFLDWIVAAKEAYLRGGRCSGSSDGGFRPIIPGSTNGNWNVDSVGNGGWGNWNSQCEEANVVQGAVSSPLYPNNYANNLRKCFRFHRAPGFCRLVLEFLDFDLEASSGCYKDYVAFSSQNRRYCGRSLAGTRAVFDLSRQSVLDLYFQSDSYGTGRGFVLGFSQLPCQGAQVLRKVSSDGRI